MKKIALTLAIAGLISFSYVSASNLLEKNPTTVEVVEDDPKAEKKDCTKAEKKDCAKAETKDCSKTCDKKKEDK